MAGKQLKAEVSNLVMRLGDKRALQEDRPEVLATGVEDLDQLIAGFPRGAIAEVVGPESSGRATLLNQLLGAATSNDEICAYVDVSDSFDPGSAAAAGVALEQILWVRCNHKLEHALKSLDYLLHGGGFGVIAFDMGRQRGHKIPSSYWYRFRQPMEHTPTILVILAGESLAKSCTALRIELSRARPHWEGALNSRLFLGTQIEGHLQKPFRNGKARIEGRVIEAMR